jgi:integrase
MTSLLCRAISSFSCTFGKGRAANPTELLFALEAEYLRRTPQPSDRVLQNPLTGDSLTRPRLYQRMLALGQRSGVPNAHPHRFRDTLAVDLLMRGASPYDVAKMLGDTIETVERHYAVCEGAPRESSFHPGKRNGVGI